MDAATVQLYRDDAADDLRRRRQARNTSPSAEHLAQLLDPRDARIVALADALLAQLDTHDATG